jgi:hypothetical protein
LALGAGGLTLAVAALGKKGWQWWVMGAAIVVLALLLLQSSRRTDPRNFPPKI